MSWPCSRVVQTNNIKNQPPQSIGPHALGACEADFFRSDCEALIIMRTTCFFRSCRHCFAALLALTVMLVGCGQHSDTVVLKVGHDLTQNTSVHKAMVYMGERLNEHSGGTMQLEVYSSGQLGAERELIELLQIGSLAMTKVSAGPMESFVPRMQVFSIPYLFRDHDHFWNVLNSDLGRDLLLAGEEVRLRGLGYYDAGSRSFYTTERAVYQPEDLAGLRLQIGRASCR